MNPHTLLIVDDSDLDRELLAKALFKKGGFLTHQATSGHECLEILATQKIDLVLMDIMMPGALGSEVLTKIRAKFNLIELPVIMVTSKTETSDIVECLHRGANDYITKPMNFEVAISRISTHLMLAEISKEMSKMKQMAALDAMVTTYNHEINNPLTVALGCLGSPQLQESPITEKLKNSLWRIADIVKKIREVTERKEVEFGAYTSTSQMLRLKK